jgi:hypothetical protein
MSSVGQIRGREKKLDKLLVKISCLPSFDLSKKVKMMERGFIRAIDRATASA